MTLTELRYIVTLAKTQHFGRAAQQCFVSQPTLSIGIKKIEKELAVAIFERRKSTVLTTSIGKKIIAQAEITLRQAQVIKELANSDKDQIATPLRVGAIHTIGPYLFPALVSRLRALTPKMPLYIEENYTANLEQKLQRGELDAIIVALPFSQPDIVVRELYREAFKLLLHRDHPWCDRKYVAATELIDTELLLLGEGHCFRDQVLQACTPLLQAIKRQHNATEGSSLETIRMMVASGLGSSVVPQSSIQGNQLTENLCSLAFSEPVPGRTVALAWRASSVRDKAIDCLLRALASCTTVQQ